MSCKRRSLTKNQSVVILYTTSTGFIQETASFIEYRNVKVNDFYHDTPFFKYKYGEISGLDCFWILPTDVQSPEDIEKYQYEITKTQLAVLLICKELGYNMPNKLNDTKMQKAATAAAEQTEALIKKFGYDPRDTSWIEDELASTDREKNWFKYDRENNVSPEDNWLASINDFNKKHSDEITPQEALILYKKRMRYILGSYSTRMSGNSDKQAWKQSAIDFETLHCLREDRMHKWSLSKQNNFPKVQVIKPIRFWHGPYFQKLIEKVPHLFTSCDCAEIKEGTILRVISYDPKLKYIRLDFTEDVSQLIRPNSTMPWVRDKADYDMWLKPNEIDIYLKFLDPLD